MITVEIKKEDILDSIYFITAIIQKQNSSSMQGALTSKGDLMGGIFDRWINTVPEKIIFNKIIIPQLKNGSDTKIISDYYLYNPKLAGIAPDVIGIKTKNKIIPFAIFNNKWQPVPDMPQIEVKTFKKNQKMISLRDQDYSGKFLVMAESELRIDYLLPFFDKSIFKGITMNNLKMRDDVFIVSDTEHKIQSISNVYLDNDNIGSITLLKITTAEEFMNSSIFCEENVSVQYIKCVEKKNKLNIKSFNEIPLSNFCKKNKNGFFRYTKEWYEGLTSDNIPYYTKKSKNGSSRTFLYRTLDFYTDKINSITVIKKSLNSIYIKTNDSVIFNDITLEKNSIYKIEFTFLDRSSNSGVEYFMQKSLITFVKDHMNNLNKNLEKIIDGGK